MQERGKSFRHSVDEPFTLGFMKPPAAFVLIVLIVLLFVLVRSARVVPAGHVGVVDLFGKVRNEGLYYRGIIQFVHCVFDLQMQAV